MNFKDLFSAQSNDYAKYRPVYPQHIFDFLATLTSSHDLVWDCGTGNGQAAVGLADKYARVFATDPSEKQIKNAVANAHVHYEIGSADRVDLPSGTVDLVTVAQAAHWFNFPAFYAEVKRVLRPNGVLAMWCYGHNWNLSPEVDAVVNRYYSEIVGEYWAPEIRYVQEHYKTIPFPFTEIQAPELSMTVDFRLDGLIGYLASWSSTQKYAEVRGENPLLKIDSDLRKAWGDPEKIRTITWPVYFRIGRI